MRKTDGYEPPPYDIYMGIAQEVENQFQKFGIQNHPDGFWLAIAVEEIGEIAKDLIENERGGERNVDEEITQLAAVCVSWLDCRNRSVRG